MSEAFTPGPWLIAETGKTFVYALNEQGFNRFWAHVQGGNTGRAESTTADELEANARLIAAAPDLLKKACAVLAMCEAIGDFRNGVTDPTGCIDEGEVRASELLSELRAAIAKALPVTTKDAA